MIIEVNSSLQLTSHDITYLKCWMDIENVTNMEIPGTKSSPWTLAGNTGVG